MEHPEFRNCRIDGGAGHGPIHLYREGRPVTGLTHESSEYRTHAASDQLAHVLEYGVSRFLRRTPLNFLLQRKASRRDCRIENGRDSGTWYGRARRLTICCLISIKL
jgi:hypothetical protein